MQHLGCLMTSKCIGNFLSCPAYIVNDCSMFYVHAGTSIYVTQIIKDSELSLVQVHGKVSQLNPGKNV